MPHSCKVFDVCLIKKSRCTTIVHDLFRSLAAFAMKPKTTVFPAPVGATASTDRFVLKATPI
jgi:hypothetical protein